MRGLNTYSESNQREEILKAKKLWKLNDIEIPSIVDECLKYVKTKGEKYKSELISEKGYRKTNKKELGKFPDK